EPSQGHERPVVEERALLLPGRADLPGLRRRRLRRPAGPHRADRLPRRDRRDVPVAHAVLPVPRARRRLRHHGLLRGGPQARDPRGHGRARAHRARPRDPRHRRPRRQPHLGPSPVVPGRAVLARLALPRLLRLARRQAGGEAGRPRLPRPGGLQLGLGRAGRPVVPAPLLHRAARPQRGQPEGARRARADRGVLAPAGPLGLPGGRRPLPARAGRDARGRDRGPARAPARPARLPRPARRGDRAARGGQPAARRPAPVLRQRRAPGARPPVQLPRHAGDVPRARPGGRHAARAGHDPAARAPARVPVGVLRAQPRRADARPALRGRARGGLRRLRARSRRAALRPRDPQAPADHARRGPGAHPDGLRAGLLPARDARPLLRRGDRDGGEPGDRGAHGRALAHAVVGRGARRVLGGRGCRGPHAAGGGRGRLRARGRERHRPAPGGRLAADVVRAAHPPAQGVPRAGVGGLRAARDRRGGRLRPPLRLGRQRRGGAPQPLGPGGDDRGHPRGPRRPQRGRGPLPARGPGARPGRPPGGRARALRLPLAAAPAAGAPARAV
ncbi:MAG: GH13_16 / GH13_36 / GH13 / GH13_31 / GH13_ 17 / GH13_4 / GH13_23 / GH13_29 / GH13_40 / GH13 _30 / GH13_35 / GH13_20 / GH13_2 / GH13_34 / GH1 3_1 / GH13_18 / GH13_21 / GH13_19 / GH13_26 / GH13_37, partial [uncultured Solirubrobacteraceae bacterium]